MEELPLNRPAGVLVKTTGVDFPGLIAASFFLKGCNLRCPYCYNVDLVLGNNNSAPSKVAAQEPENSQTQSGASEPQESSSQAPALSSIQDLFDHLEKRQGILSGLVISGGEPLLNPYTPIIIKKAKELGYKIKLDTNGTLPDELEFFVNSPALRPDFIAMDIKTSPARYASLICNPQSKFFGNTDHFEKIVARTAKIVANYPTNSREWRTVLVPGLVTKVDIEEMSSLLPKDASWQFAHFQPGSCLDSAYNDISPYTDKEEREFVNYAKSLIKGAELR